MTLPINVGPLEESRKCQKNNINVVGGFADGLESVRNTPSCVSLIALENNLLMTHKLTRW